MNAEIWLDNLYKYVTAVSENIVSCEFFLFVGLPVYEIEARSTLRSGCQLVWFRWIGWSFPSVLAEHELQASRAPLLISHLKIQPEKNIQSKLRSNYLWYVCYLWKKICLKGIKPSAQEIFKTKIIHGYLPSHGNTKSSRRLREPTLAP